MDYIVLSDSPLGESSNLDSSYVFAKTYADQLKRHYLKRLSRPLIGVVIKVKANEHDFGTYYSVIVEYDSDDDAACNTALWLENNQPEYWDETSKAKFTG